jgi:hypothetical protein
MKLHETWLKKSINDLRSSKKLLAVFFIHKTIREAWLFRPAIFLMVRGETVQKKKKIKEQI